MELQQALLPILSATIPFIVETIKQSSTQLITPETKGRLIALAAVLSTGAGIVSGFADGSIDGPAVELFVESIWHAAIAFGLTQGVYNFMKWLGVLGKKTP